jgi:Zn-dependent protease
METIFRLTTILPVFLLAIILHESAHAWAAYRLGDPTAKAMGRITLNPFPHLDPLGSIMMLLCILFPGFVFFGWAKPVQINIYNFRNPRRDFAITSLAGPISNFLQAYAWYFLFLLLKQLSLPYGFFRDFFSQLLFFGVLVNVSLLIFNLIPIPPLDGSRVIMWLLPPRQAEAFMRLERYGFLILILFLWSGMLDKIYRPLLMLIAHLFPGLLS